jgi:hypothetical protein
MNSAISKTSQRTVAGVALTNAILLVYGLFRPDSLDFSVPFLIAPSLAYWEQWRPVREPPSESCSSPYGRSSQD